MDAVQAAIMAAAGLEAIGLFALAIFEPDAQELEQDDE